MGTHVLLVLSSIALSVPRWRSCRRHANEQESTCEKEGCAYKNRTVYDTAHECERGEGKRVPQGSEGPPEVEGSATFTLRPLPLYSLCNAVLVGADDGCTLVGDS